MPTMKQVSDKVASTIVTVGVLAVLYGSVFFVGKLLSTPTVEPVEVADVNVPDISTLEDCETKPLKGEISKFFPNISECEQEKYDEYAVLPVLNNANTPNEINTLAILENGKRIRVAGEPDQIWLYIKATVDDKEYSLGRKNAVFFLADGGEYQGYLRAERVSKSELSGKSEGVFRSEEAPRVFIEDLTKPIPVSNRGEELGSTNIRFADKLANKGQYLVYSYVSKPVFGRIIDMSLAYTCKTDTCSLTIEN